jgi:hypothetical protein
VKNRNKKIAHANPEPKEKPKAKPKKAGKSVPKFDTKANRVW